MTEVNKDLNVAPNPEGQGAGAEANDVAKQLAELKAQVEESQRKITDLSNEKVVLEKRFEEFNRPQEQPSDIIPQVEQALTEAQLDPKKGAQMLSGFFNQRMTEHEKKVHSQAQEMVNTQLNLKQQIDQHVETIRKTKEHLKPYEARLAKDANLLMMENPKLGWKGSIDKAVENFEKDFPQLVPKPQQTPPSALGERGGTGYVPPTAPDAKKDDDKPQSDSEWVAELRKKRGGYQKAV